MAGAMFLTLAIPTSISSSILLAQRGAGVIVLCVRPEGYARVFTISLSLSI